MKSRGDRSGTMSPLQTASQQPVLGWQDDCRRAGMGQSDLAAGTMLTLGRK